MLVVTVDLIGQEVGSYRPAVRPQRRRQMQDEVVAEAPLALQVLASCLHAQGVLPTAWSYLGCQARHETCSCCHHQDFVSATRSCITMFDYHPVNLSA